MSTTDAAARGHPNAGAGGLAATRDILADPDLSTVRVVVLTTFAEDAY